MPSLRAIVRSGVPPVTAASIRARFGWRQIVQGRPVMSASSQRHVPRSFGTSNAPRASSVWWLKRRGVSSPASCSCHGRMILTNDYFDNGLVASCTPRVAKGNLKSSRPAAADPAAAIRQCWYDALTTLQAAIESGRAPDSRHNRTRPLSDPLAGARPRAVRRSQRDRCWATDAVLGLPEVIQAARTLSSLAEEITMVARNLPQVRHCLRPQRRS